MATVRGILVKQFGGPEVLEYVSNIVQPLKPAAKQLLVRVKSAGVNPVDSLIRTGSHVIKPSLPYTPGLDGAGLVESVGEQVSNFKLGDRVYFCSSVDGSYKELALTDEMCTFRLHDALTYQQGAAIGIPYLIAYRALVTKARLREGETVLVHGASGAVGTACCQIAKHLGAVVIGTAGTEEGMQAVQRNGADRILNHNQPGYLDELKEEGGVNIIMEMCAHVNYEKDLDLMKTHGRIVIIGCRGTAEISPRIAMFKEITVFGVFLFRASPEEYSEMGAFMSKGQADGWLRPVIGWQYPLDQASVAHAEATGQESTKRGKIVLNV